MLSKIVFFLILPLAVACPAAFAQHAPSLAELRCASLLGLIEEKHPKPVETWPSDAIFFHFLQQVDPMGAYFSLEEVQALTREHGANFVQSLREDALRVPRHILDAAAKKGRERREQLEEFYRVTPLSSSAGNPKIQYGWKSAADLQAFWLSHFQLLRNSWVAAGATSEDVQRLLAISLAQIGGEITSALESEQHYFSNLGKAILSSLDPYSQLEPVSVPAPKRIFGLTVGAFAGDLIVLGVVPGSPAALVGSVQPGDRIASVFNPETKTFAFSSSFRREEALKLVPSMPGETLRLRVYRNSEAKLFEVEIFRQEVQPSPAPSPVRAFRGDVEVGRKLYKIGVLRLDGFDNDVGPTSAQIEAQIELFIEEGMDAVLADVRNNRGGLMEEVFEVLSLFLSKEQIEFASSVADPSTDYVAKRSRPLWQGPLVVLTSKHSASGAELLAGTIQDFRRGPILGEPRTFGKGTVQTFFEVANQVPEGSQSLPSSEKARLARVTTGYFYLPKGQSPQHVGVQSDVIFPWLDGKEPLGERGHVLSLPPASRPTGAGFQPLSAFWRDGFQQRLQSYLDRRLQSDVDDEADGISDPVLEHALVLSAEYVNLLKKEQPTRWWQFRP